MSRGIPLTAINGGMTRLRVKGAARKDSLYQLTNAYVTAGNTIKPRAGTVRNADLAATTGVGATKGLVAHQGALHVFSAQKVSVPAGYVDHVLSHPAVQQTVLAPNPLIAAAPVSTLLHFEEGTGSTAFTDSGSSPHIWTAHGTAVESGTQAKFGSGSGFFPAGAAGTQYISTAINSGDSLDLSVGNFTIECFVYLTAYSAFAVTIYNGLDGGGSSSGPRIHVLTDGSLDVNYVTNSMSSAAGLMTLNTWHHVALVQDGNLLTAYIDGARAMSRNVSGWAAAVVNGHAIYIGGSAATYNALAGYIDEFRITKGFALYDGATYTVPTAALTTVPAVTYNLGALLHFDDGANTFIDSAFFKNVWTAGGTNGVCTESTVQKKFGTGSMLSSGTNSFISTPQNVGAPLDLTINRRDYTVEYFVYPTTLTAASTHVHLDFSASGTTLFRVAMLNGGTVRVTSHAPFTATSTSVTALTVNAWNHVAVVRSGNQQSLFINGILQASPAVSAGATPDAWPAVPGSGNVAFLAAAYDSAGGGSGFANGYLDEVRVTAGLALYDRTFTVPAAPGTDTVLSPIPLLDIHFAAPFMGFLYVVAEFVSDGGSGLGTVFHYWLQTSGTWLANKLYQVGQIVSPTVSNGMSFRAERVSTPNPKWAASTLKAVNDKVEPTVPNGFLYTATAVDGSNPITGTSEPIWPTLAGGVVYEESELANTGEVAGPAPQPSLTTPSPGTGGKYTNPYNGQFAV